LSKLLVFYFIYLSKISLKVVFRLNSQFQMPILVYAEMCPILCEKVDLRFSRNSHQRRTISCQGSTWNRTWMSLSNSSRCLITNIFSFHGSRSPQITDPPNLPDFSNHISRWKSFGKFYIFFQLFTFEVQQWFGCIWLIWWFGCICSQTTILNIPM
jgi:hypothetical protein